MLVAALMSGAFVVNVVGMAFVYSDRPDQYLHADTESSS